MDSVLPYSKGCLILCLTVLHRQFVSTPGVGKLFCDEPKSKQLRLYCHMVSVCNDSTLPLEQVGDQPGKTRKPTSLAGFQ